MENKKELLKYMIFAGVMGIVVGGIDTVFGKGLILIGEIRNKYFWYLIPFLPIAGIVITWLYYHFNELLDLLQQRLSFVFFDAHSFLVL